MAVTNEQLLFKITVQNDQAIAALNELKNELKGMQGSFSKTQKAVDDFGARFAKMSVVAFAAVSGIKAVGNALQGIVSPFFEAADAATKLQQALEITGSNSVQATVDQFTALGDSLESLGVASTEQILALARLGTAADQTAEQTEKLIKAAADLSVARSIPLEAAFKALSASLKGSSGALSNFLPEIKNLTEEQNKAGLAIDYVSASLGGFAARNLETYSGKMAVLNSRLGDIAEEFGTVIAHVLEMDTSIQGSTKYLESLRNTLIQNRETLVSFGKVLAAPFIYVSKVISDLAISAGGAFGFLQVTVGGLILAFGKLQVWTDKLANRSTAMGDAIVRTGQNMVDAGKSLTSAAREMLTPVEVVAELPKIMEDTSKATEKAATSMAAIKSQMMTPEQVQAWEMLKNKVVELEKAQAVAGREGADLIRSKAAADKAEIDTLIQKLKLGRELTAEQIRAAQTAKSAIDSGAQAAIDKIHSDTLTQILNKNKEIETATKSIDATRREQIQFELDSQLRLLEIERKRIDQADKASLEAIDRQKELLQAQAQKKADAGPSDGFEKIAKIGTDAAAQISGVFSTGSLGMVGGAMSMVGLVVKAIDALLDFFPNLINSIAGVFNKLTDFPETLFNAFQNMFDSIVRFISEFIPKLVESIFKSLTQIKDFANNMANAINDLADALPDIISGLIERLPEILVSLAENLLKAWIKILAAIYIKIPTQIMRGIFAGLSKLWEGIKRLMSGKSFLPKVKMDEKSVKDAVKNLGGSAGRLFSVKDLLDSAKDPLDKVTNSIKDAFKKGADWIKQAWMWVYEKIIEPIMEALKSAWMWVYEKIILPIAKIITDAWTWVDEKIIQPIIEAFKAVFNFLNDNVFKPVLSAFRSLFNWINQNVFQPFARAVTDVFSWVQEKVIDPLLTVGEKIAAPIVDAFQGLLSLFSGLGEALKSLFKLDFSGVKEAFQGIFDKGGEILKDAFKGVINPIIRLFNGVIDVLNGMVIPGVRWSVSAGKLGSWSGQLWDDIDLIPGDLSKLQTLAAGGLVLPSSGVTLQGLGSDTVPIAATPGEFIVNRRGVETAGLDMLGMINRGIAPQGQGATYNIEFEINIDAKTPMDEGFIRGKLVPAMRDELKRASLDGQFVISQRGIR